MGGWLVGARTHVGLVRDGNEDALYAGARLLVVADGVGGAVAGEIASRLAVTSLAPLDTDPDIDDPLPALRDAVRRADQALRDAIRQDPRLSGMGITLTAVLWVGESMGLAHIGDSRGYRYRDGQLSQITHDHSLVQSLVDAGEITPEEALVHPRRSWILRSLDGRNESEPDLEPLQSAPEDRYLLCSDGLSDYVDETAIAEVLGAGEDPQATCERLVELALREGAPDNVTCIVAEPVEAPPAMAHPILGGAAATAPDRAPDPRPGRSKVAERSDARQPRPPRQRGIGRTLAIVAAVVLVLVVVAVGGTWLYVRSQWYVAADQGDVAVYRGVQGNAAGVSLSHLEERSNLPASALPQDDRDRLANGITASSHDGARSVLTNLRQEACSLPPRPVPSTTQSPSPRPASRGTSTRKSTHATPTPTPTPTPVWCSSAP